MNESINTTNHLGKLQPQAVEFEEALLGALMLEKNALTAVIDILNPECFYKDAHQKIFHAIFRLFQNSQPIDILTVTNELKKSGELDIVGGPYYISQLTDRVASSANVEFHARIVLQKHIQRELIRISTDTVKDAFEDTSDVFELLENNQKQISNITLNITPNRLKSTSTLSFDSIHYLEELGKIKNGISGVPSGFFDLDKKTGGFQKSDLIILAARPGMGKTSLALALALNPAIRFKKPTAIFSLEMSSKQLYNRAQSMETGIPLHHFLRSGLSDWQWEILSNKEIALANSPMYIDDTAALSLQLFKSMARKLVRDKQIELIVIDYLQLMTVVGLNKNSNREQEISMLSRGLKAVAKELDIPIIVLSQLSREVEKRGGDKRPNLSDLRDSGAIEQDADIVMFLYRPSYYGFEQDKNGNELKKEYSELIISKHRNGSLSNVVLNFEETTTKFSDWDFDNFEERNFSEGSRKDNIPF